MTPSQLVHWRHRQFVQRLPDAAATAYLNYIGRNQIKVGWRLFTLAPTSQPADAEAPVATPL